MGDLSFTAKEESATVAAIYAWHKAKGDAEPQRGYLGASIIGHDCDRYLWYTFRACVKRDFSGRIYRLFQTGNLAESRFVAELEGIGCEVVSHDEAGKQIEVLAIGGHFSGHLDGMALGVPEAPKSWHVCEFKTHNDKSFGALQKAGVQKSKPLHYAQMMVYMGLTKVDRALYLAMNKDTDEIYPSACATTPRRSRRSCHAPSGSSLPSSLPSGALGAATTSGVRCATPASFAGTAGRLRSLCRPMDAGRAATPRP